MELEDEGIPSTTLREISVLRQLKHPNIVGLQDVVQADGRLYLVFEFVDHDLKKYFDATEGPLPQPLIQVTLTVKVIHSYRFDSVINIYIYLYIHFCLLSTRSPMHFNSFEDLNFATFAGSCIAT